MLQVDVITRLRERFGVQVNERQYRPQKGRCVTRDRIVRSSNHLRRPISSRHQPSSPLITHPPALLDLFASIPQSFGIEASAMPATRIQVFRDPATAATSSGPSAPRRRTAPALGSKGPLTRSVAVEVSFLSHCYWFAGDTRKSRRV